MSVSACGYSPACEPFDVCLYSGYSTTTWSLFDATFPCCVFTQESSRLSSKQMVGGLDAATTKLKIKLEACWSSRLEMAGRVNREEG